MTSQGNLAWLARRKLAQYCVAMDVQSARELVVWVNVLADRVGVLERELTELQSLNTAGATVEVNGAKLLVTGRREIMTLADLPLSRLRRMLRDAVRVAGPDSSSARVLRRAIARRQRREVSHER